MWYGAARIPGADRAMKLTAAFWLKKRNAVLYPWEPKKSRVSLKSRLNLLFVFSLDYLTEILCNSQKCELHFCELYITSHVC